MAWIRMLEQWAWRKPAWTIVYKAGHTYNVPHEAATLAVAAGKAVRMRKARKDEEPVPVDDETTISIVYDVGTVRRQLQDLKSKDAEPTEWQPSEVERGAYPSESTYKNGQPQPKNMGMKLAVDS